MALWRVEVILGMWPDPYEEEVVAEISLPSLPATDGSEFVSTARPTGCGVPSRPSCRAAAVLPRDGADEDDEEDDDDDDGPPRMRAK